MPEQDDWLLRQIARFAQALAAVVGARDRGETELAQGLVDEGLRQLLGLTADTLTRLHPDAVIPLLSQDGRLERDRALAAGLFLAHDADLQGAPGLAHGRRVASLGLLALALEVEATAQDVDRIEPILRAVHAGALPDVTVTRLVRVLADHDRFDRAEDVVFAALDGPTDAAFDAGMALYERLWGLPDARLQAGGLSSAEVLEGMTELQRRAGRQ